MKEENPRKLFPTPVLRLMTAAVVGTVSVQPVMSRNSAIAAAPARNFLTKRRLWTLRGRVLLLNSKTGDADRVTCQHLLFL